MITPPPVDIRLTFVAMGSQFALFKVTSPIPGALSYIVQMYKTSERSRENGVVFNFSQGSSESFSNILIMEYGGNGMILDEPFTYYYAGVIADLGDGNYSQEIFTTEFAAYYGFSGATQTWSSPITGDVTICLTGGGAGNSGASGGGGGNGGMMVAKYGVTMGTPYNITVGGGATNVSPGTAFGAGGVTGGTGIQSGGSMSQFHTVMYAGGGGAGSPQPNVRGGHGGTFGYNGSAGVGGDGSPGVPYNGFLGGPGKGATMTAHGAGGSSDGSGSAGSGSAGSGSAGHGQGGNGGSGDLIGCGGGAGYFGGGGGGGGVSGGGQQGGGGGGSSYKDPSVTILNTVNYAADAYYIGGVSGGTLPMNGVFPTDYLATPTGCAGNGACVIWW
jgi:hypothetical protein